MIYPVGAAIQLVNNWGQMSKNIGEISTKKMLCLFNSAERSKHICVSDFEKKTTLSSRHFYAINTRFLKQAFSTG